MILTQLPNLNLKGWKYTDGITFIRYIRTQTFVRRKKNKETSADFKLHKIKC